MRRSTIAAFVLLTSVSLVAQHGGGHAAGGHTGFSGSRGISGHGTFSGPRMSGAPRMSSAPRFSSRPRMSSGIRYSSGISRRVHPGFSRDPFLHDRRGPIIRTRNGFRNCISIPCRPYYAYPLWGYSGYYDPYWWWDQSSYDDDNERERQIAAEMNQQSLDEQIRRQEDAADRDQDIYANSEPSAKAETPGTPIASATILIFRDQHRQEVRNYAIVGQTLWNFSPQHTQKIPIADLDVAATVKANEDQGITFRVPETPPGQ